MAGLNVSDIVDVSVTLSPTAAALRNFGSLVIIGPTEGVIDTTQRLRSYSALSGVATDFASNTPEYQAAVLFFEQSPQPASLYIGRWAQNDTHAVLHGATLSATNQLMTTWNAISNGSFTISIDGVPHQVQNLNFANATNMNGVASIIQAGLPVGALCVWNASYKRFDLQGATAGTSGSISYGSSTGIGTDISTLAGLTAASGASAPVAGIGAETPLQAITALTLISNGWYGAMFAPTNPTDISDSTHEAVANYIEAQDPSRVYGITITNPGVLDPTQTGDLASTLKSLGLQHTVVQYSSVNNYAVASLFGRIFTTNFNANNSVITLKFKQEPGIIAESLNETQAAALKSKNCNVFVNYNNGVAIIQEGVMSGGWFFDERQGLDWLQNSVQTGVFNVLYQSATKVPQTDAGTVVLQTAVEAQLANAVNNGLIAPGTWTGDPIGVIKTGQALPRGYYTYAPPVSTQNDADRAARKAPAIQCAIKLAGAVHFANVSISANR